jgi:hypothetical protein
MTYTLQKDHAKKRINDITQILSTKTLKDEYYLYLLAEKENHEKFLKVMANEVKITDLRKENEKIMNDQVFIKD